jgi:hypothetical protein
VLMVKTDMECHQAATTGPSLVFNHLRMLREDTITRLLGLREGSHLVLLRRWDTIRLITPTPPICHHGPLDHWDEVQEGEISNERETISHTVTKAVGEVG